MARPCNGSDRCARVSPSRVSWAADEHFGGYIRVSVGGGWWKRNGVDAVVLTQSFACNLLSYDGYFVDLFVRISNTAAIKMYEKFGYVVYRRVLKYYSGIGGPDEDAFGRCLFIVVWWLCMFLAMLLG